MLVCPFNAEACYAGLWHRHLATWFCGDDGKTARQKSAALEAKLLLRKTDYRDSMQDAFRLCRNNCDSHIKDLDKKVKQAKKAKSGELGEIQKLIAGLFRD